ncbi:MAG: hypothetical protein PF904_19680 [Kiritimatiellae bacterium]|jgi:hypothetical protein|nr:hypothetical protein [Kiritimatiellia bacterium]
MKHFILFICIYISLVSTLIAERPVFDMPEAHAHHLQLLTRMNDAHKRHDFRTMEAITHQGISLGTSDNLWTYNLACALALQNNIDEAIERLQEAINLGFDDLEHIKTDSDLKNLHQVEKFITLVDTLQQNLNNPDYRNPALRQIMSLPQNAENNVYQAATNTIWSFSTGLFHTFMALYPPPTNAPSYRGFASNLINSLDKESTSNNIPTIIYVNRDNNATTIDTEKYPGLLTLKYTNAFKKRNLNMGQPNTLFVNENSGRLIPAVGNSSMGFINSSYWRCQPRALFNDPVCIQNQIALLMGNQIFCYPTYSDYNPTRGDLFSANTPYYIAVAGQAKSEKIYVEAVIATISALRNSTREYLSRKGLLMSTIQMLLRKSQKSINGDRDYLTGIAHPAAFQTSQLDIEKLINNAHALTTNSIPPLVFISVKDKSELNPQLDMPTCVYSEQLFNTHLAVACVFRAFPYKRRLSVKTFCKDEDAKIHCVILQGDPNKILITQSEENPKEWIIEIAHHTPFMTPISGGAKILTSRADIGFFAENANGLSLPAIVSCNFLGNEKRTYTPDGKLLSIDYRRHTAPYTDPLLSYPRNWKDEFKHDSHGHITGWTRIRARKTEQFTAYGDLSVEFDDKGRTTLARHITYTPRYIGSIGQKTETLPALAQVDDNIEVRYTYASDEDFIGKPNSTTTKKFNPPPMK